MVTDTYASNGSEPIGYPARVTGYTSTDVPGASVLRSSTTDVDDRSLTCRDAVVPDTRGTAVAGVHMDAVDSGERSPSPGATDVSGRRHTCTRTGACRTTDAPDTERTSRTKPST